VGVLTVSRIAPQTLGAFQVSTANAGVAFALQNALMAIGSQASMKVTTGLGVANLLQVGITQPSLPDQFAWPGDWVLVTDATYNAASNVWTVSSTTQVIVYGIGVGQIGTRQDFVNTFTADTPLVWDAATPTVTSESAGVLNVSFPAPTSADGPWTWKYTLTNVTSQNTSAPTTFTPTESNGVLSTVISGVTTGDAYTVTVTVADNYQQTATSAPSTSVTA